MFQGLNALQDRWLLNCLVTHTATDVQVNVQRYFLNNRIPIFQFGIFYDDDMEFHPGPRFDFGGRVHSNANLFFAGNTGLYFSSKVTAHKQVFTDVGKNGSPYSTWGDNVHIKNADGSIFWAAFTAHQAVSQQPNLASLPDLHGRGV
ncbi:MAG: hypothetical protein H7Z42_00815 [Roseiflexaceae bacterium]|nr:hypothetical protein [Roseiflexaceae bacterium]